MAKNPTLTDRAYFETIPIPRAIVKFVGPTVLSQLISLAYHLADTFFVGRTNDPRQIAALTLSFPLFMFLTGIANLTGIGANSLISRSLGVRDETQAKRASAFGFYGAIAVTLLFMAALTIWMRPILNVVGASPDTYDFTVSYLMITVVFGGLPTVLTMVMGHLVRAEGKTKQASIGMSVGCLLNIALDALMVYVFKMGIAGAAWATLISNVVSMCYFFVILHRNRGTTVAVISPKYLGWYPTVISQVLLVGFPSALLIVYGSAANIILTHFMSGYGDINVAGFGIAQKVSTIAIQITGGVSQGVMPLVGYNYGAKNYDRMKKTASFTFVILAVFCVLCVVIIELFPRAMVSIFIGEPETIRIGAEFLRRVVLCIPGQCFVSIFNSIFQATGHWKQALFMYTFRQLLLMIPLLILFNHLFGMFGLAWAQPVSDTLSLVFGFVLYIRMIRKLTAKTIET